MPPKLIIFDWDGTLADTTTPIIRAVQQTCIDCGLPEPEAEQIRPLIGYSMPRIIQTLAPNLSAEMQQKLAHTYATHSLNPNNQNMQLFPDTIATLNTLKAQGYWLAVATGKSRTGLDQSIAQTYTANYWLATRCASECRSKPAPDMVLELCNELGLSPKETIIIGDTTHDLNMAANAKARGIGITTGAHKHTQLQNAPHIAIIESLNQLPQLLATLASHQTHD